MSNRMKETIEGGRFYEAKQKKLMFNECSSFTTHLNFASNFLDQNNPKTKYYYSESQVG